MERFSYYTIEQPAAGVYKEKGSKFLAFAFPVSSEAEIREELTTIKKEYFDARHHCFAYMLGPERKQFRAFDDGEPNHSAGDPILGQIRSHKLTDILVVVVRYFGGVKLGVGGLIGAYRSAADDALSKARIIQCEVRLKYRFYFDYSSTAPVMKLIKDFDLEVLHQKFTDDCEIIVNVPARVSETLLDKIDLLQSMGTQLRLEPCP
jgi:uncharacterized YigZ family protein